MDMGPTLNEWFRQYATADEQEAAKGLPPLKRYWYMKKCIKQHGGPDIGELPR